MIKNLNMDCALKMQRCNKYIEALEEERCKIQVFQRELPLCLELVTQAIEARKRELSGTSTEYVHGQSECSEQTTGECGPVLEEFIPIKRSSSRDEDDEHESQGTKNNDDKISTNNIDKNMKSDWLRSVQLWSQSPDPLPKEEQVSKKQTLVNVERNSGTFQPLEKSVSKSDSHENRKPPEATVAAASSTAGGSSGGKKEPEKEGGKRKLRRCWSPELHRQFLDALQQLGGSHVATPKQIRELMKVDGLSNDEVKSHLQKYRLHTSRPSQTVPNNGNPNAPPKFVVVGGIWVPQPDYPVGTATRIYTAVAAPPPQRANQMKSQPLISEERSGSHCRGGVRCNSPATSSSTRTTAKQ